MEYEIPITSAYKYGPYMHSVQENYEQSNSPSSALSLLANSKTSALVQQLKSKISLMKQQEKEFYDLFGVSSAIEFSKVYLLNMHKTVDSSATISQKLLSVLNSPEVFTVLTAPAEDVRPKLEKIAQQVLLENPALQTMQSQHTEYVALNTLKDLFNSMKESGDKISLNINSQKLSFDAPKKQLRSIQSSYIKEVLSKANPEIMDSIRRDYSKRIDKVISIFDRQKQLFGDEYEFYRDILEKHLRAAAGLTKGLGDEYLKEKNLGLFGNFASAEGGIFEIVLTMGLKPSKTYTTNLTEQNTMLANEVVEDYKYRYNITSNDDSNVAIMTTKKGEKWRVKYKSPTDLIIQNKNGKFYSIQLKNTLSNITDNSLLKLQGTIQLPTFLANVSDVISDADTLKLLVYHIVNNSTFPYSNTGLGFINKILSACIEYYVESRYLRQLDQNITDINGTANMGNMFMIYSGYLIPISAFGEYAIEQIEKEGSIVFNEGGFFQYGLKYEVNEIKGKTFEERIEMGVNVYESTKITQINVAIGKVLDYMNAFTL